MSAKDENQGEPQQLVESEGVVESSAETLVDKNTVQDFYKIRAECIAKQQPWEDPQFKHVDQSVFYSKDFEPKNIKWMRPKDLVKTPHFLVEGASRFDVKQGDVGDCWVGSVISTITLQPALFNHVVPKDQSFADDNVNVFHFRFWQFGTWIEVVVDDWLPTSNGKLMYLQSSQRNEFWSALLEKAYAKLKGSYEGLHSGNIEEAIVDFTGGIVERYYLQNPPPNLFQMMLKAQERNCLMGFSLICDTEEEYSKENIVHQHTYSITMVKYIDSKASGKVPLVRIRNPWGNEKEWNGSWSDKSSKWCFVPESEKQKLELVIAEDGETWISYDSFIENFWSLAICTLTPDALTAPKLPAIDKKCWQMDMYKGKWVKGVSTGFFDSFRSFARDPRYQFTLTEVDEDNKCTVIISLMQKCRRHLLRTGVQFMNMLFLIYKSEDPDPPFHETSFFDFEHPVGYFGGNDRDATKRFHLSPGVYSILPFTAQDDEEGEFFLRIFYEKSNNTKTSTTKVMGMDFDDAEEDFAVSANEDKEMDWMELKEYLKRKSLYDCAGLSEESFRSVMEMFGVDSSGKLGADKIKRLIAEFSVWTAIFEIFSKDDDSYINTTEFLDFLKSTGYPLSKDVLNALAHRYADKDGIICFENYIICAFKLVKTVERCMQKGRTASNIAKISNELLRQE